MIDGPYWTYRVYMCNRCDWMGLGRDLVWIEEEDDYGCPRCDGEVHDPTAPLNRKNLEREDISGKA